jgi:hypothetical protein
VRVSGGVEEGLRSERRREREKGAAAGDAVAGREQQQLVVVVIYLAGIFFSSVKSTDVVICGENIARFEETWLAYMKPRSSRPSVCIDTRHPDAYRRPVSADTRVACLNLI